MTRAQRHQLGRHWREPREKETDAGETRDAGTCVSHGLPMATHAANVRGYRPYSFRTTLPVHVREKRAYSIRNSVGCTTTRTTTRLYNGKREVRFVCVHTRGRVNWFRLRVRCHDVAIRSKHAMKPRYRRLRAPRRDILTTEWRSFGHNPLCKEVGEWNRVYTISSLALNWKTMLTFSCFPCICSFLSFFFVFFFESFDRDDGMPLDVANIEISIAASISLRIPPLFRIHISTLYIFIYPWWQKDNFCRMIRIIVILVLDSKLLNRSKFEKEFSSSPFSNFPFFLCPSSFIYVITYPIRNNYPYPKNSNSRSVLTREEFELASIQRRMQSYRHGSCILAQSYCAHQLTALMP